MYCSMMRGCTEGCCARHRLVNSDKTPSNGGAEHSRCREKSKEGKEENTNGREFREKPQVWCAQHMLQGNAQQMQYIGCVLRASSDLNPPAKRGRTQETISPPKSWKWMINCLPPSSFAKWRACGAHWSEQRMCLLVKVP